MGVAVGFVGPKVGWGRWTTHGIGALFAALLIPILAGWAIAARARRSGRRSGSPPTARSTPTSTSPGGTSCSRTRRSTTSWCSASIVWGTMQFASLRGLRASPAAQRGGHRGPRAAGEHGAHRPDQLAVSRRVHRGVAVPADRDARLRRACDLAPAPDRRPVARSPSLYLRGGDRVHPRRDGGLACCSPSGQRRRRSPAPGTGSTTSSSGSAQDFGRLFPVGGDVPGRRRGQLRLDGARSRTAGSATTASPSRRRCRSRPRACAGGRRRTTRSRSRRGSRRSGDHGGAGPGRRPAPRRHARGAGARVHARYAGHGPAGRRTTTACCSPTERRRR